MDNRTLHITNGNSLTDYLKELGYNGDILSWQEMLCEGPTAEFIDSEEFFELRKNFLRDYYDLEVNEQEFRAELDLLNHPENYNEIVLWFEYDLFCHINLIAVISLIVQKNIQLPLYLVCSGRVEGEKGLKGLAELSPEQLYKHYETKIRLTEEDINLMKSLWKTYCGIDHNLFKPTLTKSSSFRYLSNCLKAHLKRFPDSQSGLSTLEKNTLELINKYPVKSRKHLLGYVLNYQGYYGFGDTQIIRMIEKLAIFFDEDKERLQLNRKGHEAILGQHNFASELNNNLPFGGVEKFDYYFNKNQNKLIKTA